MGRKLSSDEIKTLLAAEIARIMEPVAKPLPIYPKKPQVVLVVGVNGSGKTTILDAVHYLSICKSFLNSVDSQNIKRDQPFLCLAERLKKTLKSIKFIVR